MRLTESERTALAMLPHLGECAKNKRTIRYGEIAAKLGKHQRGLSHALAYIRTLCERHKLPRLDVLVVLAGSAMPGESFFEGGRGDMPEDAYRDLTDSLRGEVFAYTKWDETVPRLIAHYGGNLSGST